MGVTIERGTVTLLPEGWHRFKILGSTGKPGQFGLTIEWALQSDVRGDDGVYLTTNHLTGARTGANTKFHELAVACGLDPDSVLDSDELHGAIFEGRIDHQAGAKGGIFGNIGACRQRKTRGKPAADAPPHYEPEEEE